MGKTFRFEPDSNKKFVEKAQSTLVTEHSQQIFCSKAANMDVSIHRE